ncbi:exportin-4-like [Ceratina calcarata]|uniref:Exportin-4 n=1 Tax=Ceratina calcarata TaxID=156304 RepID=A0AAJ7JG30_9HYME|nr:exportin-4-like [Ceratina calcarata]
MAGELIRELEKAAQVILAPPNLISSEQRRTAEDVFLNFRKLRSPYELCSQILETNTNDYILFETVGLIRIALIHEWQQLSQTDISSLRDYLLRYVINRQNLPPYVKASILQVIAIIIEKGSMNDSGQARQQILGEVENLIITGDLPKKILGCNLISALLQQYAINSKSSYIGLSFADQVNEKKLFETHDLRRIFSFCIRIINELIKKDLQDDSIALLKHLLPILENVFTWQFFRPKGQKFVMSVITSQSPLSIVYKVLRLDKQWRDIMLTPEVLDLVFTLYWKIRGNLQLAHHVRTCLIQMVNIHDDVLSDERVVQYYISYLDRFLKLVTSIEIIDEEASGIANITNNLFKEKRIYGSYPENMLKSFMEQLSRLTCSFLELAAQEESSDTDEYLYTEAIDILFTTWFYILRAGLPESLKQTFSQSHMYMFDTYLRCHLSPPEGVRNIVLQKEETEDDDVDGMKFKGPLKMIATFGRQIPSYTLPLLAQLIEDRTSKLRENLNRSMEQRESLNAMENDSMSRLYEDLYWLILMIGNVIGVESRGEVSIIPSEIVEYGIEQVQQGKVDMNATSQYLALSEYVSPPMNISIESVDHVIRLIADICRLCSIERTAMSVRLDSILSPELSRTLIWFLHRTSEHYLLPDYELYACSDIKSLAAAQTFSEDTPGACWFIDFLLEKIELNINAFKSEPAVMEETMYLLTSLVKTREKANYVLKAERFRRIVNLAINEHLDFPQTVRRGLMQAVVQIAVTLKKSIDESYTAESLQPLLDRFKQITSNDKFLQIYQQENIKLRVIDILECFIGVAQGAQGSKAGTMYRYLQPVLRQLPHLLSLYHNYQEVVELILELLYECTREPAPVLRRLDQSETAEISEIFLSTIQNYRRWNSNRLTVDTTAEDNSYEDILLLLKLSTNLLYESIFEDESVFLHSLTIIMPMMTTDLLKFPSLCVCYFQMIQSLCRMHARQVFSFPPKILQPLLASIELGLFSFGSEVFSICCCAIDSLTQEILRNLKDNRPQIQVMAPFLNSLINVILTQQVNSDFVDDVSLPLFNLIRCYRDEYNKIVQNILSTQTDQQIVERLANAFTKLVRDVELHANRRANVYFDVFYSLNEFICNVRGCFMIK